MTFQDLQSFVELTGNSHEIKEIHETIDSEEYLGNGMFIPTKKEVVIGYEFGINNLSCKKGSPSNQWYWFKCFCLKDEQKDKYMFFDNRYSCVNGKSYKGVFEEMKAEKFIERVINK